VGVAVAVGVVVGVMEGVGVGVRVGAAVGVSVGAVVAVGVAVWVRVGVNVGVGVVRPWSLRLTVWEPPPCDSSACTFPVARSGRGPHSSLTSVRMTMISFGWRLVTVIWALIVSDVCTRV
jgi:hypothetical protein